MDQVKLDTFFILDVCGKALSSSCLCLNFFSLLEELFFDSVSKLIEVLDINYCIKYKILHPKVVLL